ncbi:MAG TPA: NAD(P)/FAD-dependent oxidoreductase [Candidatus Bathyarchaeia archaeon]|nr:NAD(P)/FAD-dependent oxidoreductase [Candidatus Bathyarchaeia archaeon]
MNLDYDLVIIGGGPAGMMAAIAAAKEKKRICILERNRSLGKKLLLTGKGRCNFTTAGEIDETVDAFGKKGKFLYRALTGFSNQDLISFFNDRGIITKIERGKRVFPESDQASTILDCLIKEIEKEGIPVVHNFRVTKIFYQDNCFKIFSQSGRTIVTDKLIIATGGKSYPETGSTGDGYRLAAALGHKINPLKPALAPLFVKDPEVRLLAGLSLKNVKLSIRAGGKEVVSFFGEMLFTHQGISGPIVLETSKEVYDRLRKKQRVEAVIDLKPALDREMLKNRIYRDIHQIPKKEARALLKGLLPKLLIPLSLKKTKINGHKQNSFLTKEEVFYLIDFLKDFSFQIDGVAPLKNAIVTAGGVDIGQIDSRTMGSKLVRNLFFAGEIIDLDGPTGGYNLQKAFSTGWLAGSSAI